MSGSNPVGTVYEIASSLQSVDNMQITVYDNVSDRYSKWVDALVFGSGGANFKGAKCKRLLTGATFTIQAIFLGK